MTYENAVAWILEHYDLDDFDDYNDFWENGIKQDASFSPRLIDSTRFRDVIDRKVFSMKPEWKDGLQPPIGMEHPPIVKVYKRPARQRTLRSIRTFEQVEFTTKQVYEANPTRPRPSLRRELQELVKRNKIQRVRIGVYKNVS